MTETLLHESSWLDVYMGVPEVIMHGGGCPCVSYLTLPFITKERGPGGERERAIQGVGRYYGWVNLLVFLSLSHFFLSEVHVSTFPHLFALDGEWGGSPHENSSVF